MANFTLWNARMLEWLIQALPNICDWVNGLELLAASGFYSLFSEYVSRL